jgi:hypothetical protein
VLNGPWADTSQLRNVLMYSLSRGTGRYARRNAPRRDSQDVSISKSLLVCYNKVSDKWRLPAVDERTQPPLRVATKAAPPGCQRGRRYAPRTRFLELFIVASEASTAPPRYPEDYYGVYVFTEAIRRSADRVDVEKASDSTAATGYILKVDWPDADEKNRTIFLEHSQMEIIVAYPKNEKWTRARNQSATAFLRNLDALLAAKGTQWSALEALMDMTSWAERILFFEFGTNWDGLLASFYMSMRSGGKLAAFPLWDDNMDFGTQSYDDGSSPPPSPGTRARASALLAQTAAPSPAVAHAHVAVHTPRVSLVGVWRVMRFRSHRCAPAGTPASMCPRLSRTRGRAGSATTCASGPLCCCASRCAPGGMRLAQRARNRQASGAARATR